MNIAIFCEKSGIMREAFRARGHNVWSFDLLPSEDNSPYHVIGDCRPYVDARWDMAICHPVCTRLALSGVRWLFDPAKASQRWLDLLSDIEFFELFLKAKIKRKVIENSAQHSHNFGRIPKHSQIIHPWQHGHLESKQHWLWIEGLPLLKPTNDVRAEMLKLPKTQTHKVHHMANNANRAADRARTFPGIARAFAEQYG